MDADDDHRLSYARNRLVGFTGSRTGCLTWALWDIHSYVFRKTRDFLCLHAGAVANDGLAILLPGGEGSGKSTLVAALLGRGWSYLSDELGVIDPVTGRAYPFPKRITLAPSSLRMIPGLADRLGDREGVSAGLRDRYAAPEDLGTQVAQPSPIRAVIFLTSDREGDARLTPMTRSRSVQEMAAQSLNLSRFERRGMVLLGTVAQGAEAYSLSGGTPEERAALLTARLGPGR